MLGIGLIKEGDHMSRQIKIISHNSFEAMENDVNDFLQTYPEARILGIHPKQMDAKGLVAVISYSGDLKPYQQLLNDIEGLKRREKQLEVSLQENLGQVEHYQQIAQKAQNEAAKFRDENAKLRKVLEESNKIEDEIEKFDFDPDNLLEHHSDWIEAYEDETGRKAIHRGVATKGFKQYVKSNYQD